MPKLFNFILKISLTKIMITQSFKLTYFLLIKILEYFNKNNMNILILLFYLS